MTRVDTHTKYKDALTKKKRVERSHGFLSDTKCIVRGWSSSGAREAKKRLISIDHDELSKNCRKKNKCDVTSRRVNFRYAE